MPNSYIKFLLRYLALLLLRLYVRLVYITSQIDYRIDESTQALLQGEKPFLIAFWHNRILMMSVLAKRKGLSAALISSHKDGDLLQDFLKIHGYEAIRGSSRRDSLSAIRNILKYLQQGYGIAITPDGPTGPKYKCNGNLLKIAAKANVPLIQSCYGASRAVKLNTWDEFIIPLPFSRLILIMSAPKIYQNLENLTDNLEEEMINMTNSIDQELMR